MSRTPRDATAVAAGSPAQAGSAVGLRFGRGRPYTRILWTVVAVNVVIGVVLAWTATSGDAWLGVALTAASINIGLAGIARQQYVVNGLFTLATAVPLTLPLRVRNAAAHIHHLIAGLHVGSAISATSWFLAYAISEIITPVSTAGRPQHAGIVTVVCLISAVLVTMMICARPGMREKHHDLFEASHRYGSWAALILFAVLTVLHAAAADGPALSGIIASPNPWILLALFVFTAIPWIQLRRVRVIVDVPSEHVALVTFPHGHVRAGSASKVARHPLGQWHAFANVTHGGDGYRIAISRAGGWTERFISEQPDALWKRGVPTIGVGSVSRLFRRVVWVGTGSGIAPVLPHLIHDSTPARLIWVTRNPVRTYGAQFVSEIHDAAPDLLEWDSDERGKPDVVALALQVYRETGAEAVICISNKRTTLRVVAALRAQGVPAFGPIWDS